jgi:adenosylhomocysteine nucleosidase
MAQPVPRDQLCEIRCVLFALGREAHPFLRSLRPHRLLEGAPCPARFAGPAESRVLVMQTGMGRERTEAALAWLGQRPLIDGMLYRPRGVISAGFAGALHPDLRVGDLVLATEVWEQEEGCVRVPWSGPPPTQDRPTLQRGRIATATRPVADAQAKIDLGKISGALSVDMESAWVARWCRQQGIAFCLLRAISDDAGTSFSPALQALLHGGEPSVFRIAAAVVRSPRLLGELLRLARDTHLAAEELGKALMSH